MSKSKTRSASSSLGRRLAGVALFAGVASAAGPVAAQTVADELTVTGHYRVGSDVRTLTSTVSYHDLNLTTATGRNVLSQRVRTAARDLCRRLGEPSNAGQAAAPSCERDAINSTREQQRLAVANARPNSNSYAVNPPAPAPAPVAPAAQSYGQGASSVTNETVTNPPVRDTPQNRATYGGPASSGGQSTTPNGN
jgi:UrcA family protein